MTDKKTSKAFLEFVFDEKNDMRVCDYIGYIWYVAASANRAILEELIRIIDVPLKGHRVMDIRDRLRDIQQRANNQIGKLESVPAESLE
jgi:hypothetical protein